MKHGLVLVRHGEVAGPFRQVCYGGSDVPLGERGARQSQAVLDWLGALPVRRVVHSGLVRTRDLAAPLAERCGARLEQAAALRERSFGSWEGRCWSDLHQEHGDDLLRVITEPASYRPGGGETTQELEERAWNWLLGLRLAPPEGGLTVAVCHGGPIAAIRGRLLGLPARHWLPLIPACGGHVFLADRILPRPAKARPS